MNEQRITLIIDIASRDGHLSGRVRPAGGPDRGFSGRLGLMGAIDALVIDTTGAEPSPGPAPTDIEEAS